jgi:hypothetical protein
MKNITRALLAIALTVSNMANAATDSVVCSGKIETLAIHGTDRVFLQLQGMNTVVQICSLGVTMGTTYPVTAQQCKPSYGALMFALATDRTMSIHFDNVVTGTNCTNFVAYEVATARNIALTR